MRPREAIPLEVRALGQLEVHVGGVAIPTDAWQDTRGIVLLAYLCDSGRAVPAEQLRSNLWPQTLSSPTERDADVLLPVHTAVSSIRKAFRAHGAADPIVLEQDCYSLSPLYALSWDVALFEAACDQVRQREDETVALMALYRGGFLDGCTEAWVLRRREALAGRLVDALQWAADRCVHHLRPQQALVLLERAVDVDPCRQSVQLSLLRCLSLLGRREDALRRYQDAVRELQRRCGVGPGAELLGWYEAFE